MAIDASIYQGLRPVEMPSILDTATKASNLSSMAMQQRHLGQQMQQEEMASRLQKASLFGNALESMSGMDAATRAQAYPKMRQQLMAQGVLSDQDAPSEYDDGFYRSSLMRYRQTKDYLDKAKTRAEINHLNAQAQKDRAKGVGLTPGQEKADEAFGKEAADYYYGGGKAAVEKNMGRLEGAIGKLETKPGITGGLSTRIPILNSDTAQDTINPEMAAVRDDIRAAIQGTLKQVLGGQFTEKEGEAIFNRAFNPRLSPQENVKRARAELQALQNMASEKDRSMNAFLSRGTLKGYTPSATNLAGGAEVSRPTGSAGGMVNEAYAAPPQPKHGEVVDGYVFMGGDASNPKSWKRAR